MQETEEEEEEVTQCGISDGVKSLVWGQIAPGAPGVSEEGCKLNQLGAKNAGSGAWIPRPERTGWSIKSLYSNMASKLSFIEE